MVMVRSDGWCWRWCLTAAVLVVVLVIVCSGGADDSSR